MRILVDLDDVVADLEGRIRQLWQQQHPDVVLFPSGERTNYYIGSGLSSDYASEIYHLMHGPGFFSSLDTVEGAPQALHELISLGHDVFIVTSSGVSYPLAATEKYQWVETHLGHHMLAHLVITPVKFVVDGDILIDDRPEIDREDQASWEHVLFDRPYNRQQTTKRRLNWQNYNQGLGL